MTKSKWDTVKDKLILVEGWARDGLTDEQIAHNLGISKDTFYKYKREHADFSESLKKGKEVIDFEVENALLKRALGYEFEEVTKEHLYNPVTGEPILDEEGKHKFVVSKVVKKQVSPDTTAQIFWLKNRKPKKWGDKQDINNTDILIESPKDVQQLIANTIKLLNSGRMNESKAKIVGGLSQLLLKSFETIDLQQQIEELNEFKEEFEKTQEGNL